MKKLLTVFATISVALLIFAYVSNKTQANQPVFQSGSQDDLERAKEISLEILKTRTAARSVGNIDEFDVERVFIDDLRMAHTRVQQKIGKIPVWEGEAIVHLETDGSLFTVTDDLKDGISVNTEPNISAEDATKMALDLYKGSEFLTEKPKIDLWIYRGADRDHLAYRVRLYREDNSLETAMPVIFIDAQTGEKVFQYDNLQTATGSGSSLYSGTVSIETYFNGSTYYLEDISRKVGTFDNRNTTNSTYRFSDADNNWTSSTQRAGVDAHYGAEKTYDYYLNVHGRNGIDGAGGPAYYQAADGSTGLISSKVHYSSNYNNAFWNGSYMTYGDGNGSTFSPLVTLDICGHEMTHGVTERTANLTYSGESGALNESMSDVFGAMVELYARGSLTSNVWKIGEDAYTPGTSGDALRYMDNPHAAPNSGFTSDDDPDHYSERYTGSSDNGGVHINSGIGNKVFYLVAVGGTHHLSGVTVTGVGTNAAEKIWYRALTVYMTSGTNFSGARTATLNAAANLYGSSSSQYNTVATAWCAAGVGSCPSGTPTPTPTSTPTPTPTPGGGGELIVNGGFEGSASPWVGSGSGYFYTSNGNYPHGGSGYIYLGVNNRTSGQSYQTVSIPSNASGNLTFWLNVTSSETTTTRQYDRLFVEVRNASGGLLTTLATYSNLNKGTAGVYSQKSFNLAAYRGQTVRLQFRVTTDRSLSTTFRVDDVSLE
ncbi:MAG: M4 family metallopeptidase [Pyrinomonadaceae bacterium]